MLRTRWQLVILAFLAMVVIGGFAADKAAAQTLQAQLRFNVGANASSFSFSESANGWAVSYDNDNTVRFFDANGNFTVSHTPTLSTFPLSPVPLTQPHVLDVAYNLTYHFIVGDPNATQPQVKSPYSDLYETGTVYYATADTDPSAPYPVTYSYLEFHSSDVPLQLSRFDYANNGFGQMQSVGIGLDIGGRYIVAVDAPSGMVDLSTIDGVGLARSVIFENQNLNYALLHDGGISILKNPENFERYLASWTSVGDADPEEHFALLSSFDISGLPLDADLVDLDQLGFVPVDHGSYMNYFVLDSDGNVYELVPEPATMSMLGLGLAAMVARRRRANRH